MSHRSDHEVLERARERSGLSLLQLWLAYFELGGLASEFELEACLAGILKPAPFERDLIVHAINERFLDLGLEERLPYVGAAGQTDL